MLLYRTRTKLKDISSVMAETTLIIPLILLVSCLLCNVFLALPSFTNTLPNTVHTHTALAIPNQLQKNNNNITSPTTPAKPVNHPPVANAGVNQTINEKSPVILNGIASDPDPVDSKLSYSWKQVAGPSVKLNNNDTTNPSFTAPTVSSDRELKFLLTAKDDKGAASSNYAIVTVTVKHVNQPPVANAGQENQVVNSGDIVTLDGSKSKDPDSSDTLSYLWTQTAGPTVKLDGANSPIATFTAPSNNISSDTTLVFKLTVKDSKNGTGAADVKVTDKYIPPPNQPPTANAGVDQTVNAGDNVHLDGTKSKDPDGGTIASYSWKQVGGPAVTLDGANTATPTFTAPSNISSSVVLVFGLTVADDKNATGISTAKMTVNPVNHPPVANAGTDQTVNPGYVVSLDGSKSKDPDNDPLTYSWKQIGGPAVTLDGADTAIATFTAPKDISSDTNTTFQLTVTDSKNATNTSNVKVTAKYIPPPNQPPVANAGIDQTVNAGNTVTLDGSGSTDPDGNITSDSWMQTAGPAVTLSDANVASPTFTAPSVSSDTEFKFSLTVKDDKGAASNNPAIVSVSVKAAISSNEYSFIRKWGSKGTGDGQFNGPTDLAVDSSSGNVYVADSLNNRIQKFDSKGNFLLKWGYNHTVDAQLNPYLGSPILPIDVVTTVAVDSSGNVYVADSLNNRIQKFDSNGKFITKWGSFCILSHPSGCIDPDGPDGPLALGDGQFGKSGGIAVDSSGNVYVADSLNYRIQKFDSKGNFITKWGSKGTGDGQFGSPNRISVDPSSGNVYVTDNGLPMASTQKFDSNGKFITFITRCLTPSGYNKCGLSLATSHVPFGVAIDSTGNVYVADNENEYPIQKFDSNGKFITKWGSVGSGDGQLTYPNGIAVDSSGNVYVDDWGNNRIQIFAPSSTTSNNNTSTAIPSVSNMTTATEPSAVGNITGGNMTSAGNATSSDNITYIGTFIGFDHPYGGIAIDSSNNVYLDDSGNKRIQKFDGNGDIFDKARTFTTKWGSKGTGDGEFNGPWGIAVDSSGNIYVADTYNYRIQKFNNLLKSHTSAVLG